MQLMFAAPTFINLIVQAKSTSPEMEKLTDDCYAGGKLPDKAEIGERPTTPRPVGLQVDLTQSLLAGKFNKTATQEVTKLF